MVHARPACRQAGSKSCENYMYFTYALKSKEKSYIYVGISDNPERRISQHNLGYNKTIRPYCPFDILLIEKHANRNDAREREKYLKSGCGKEFLKNIK